MELIRILASRLKALFGGRRLDAELDDEVRAHIAMAVERMWHAACRQRRRGPRRCVHLAG